MPESAIRITSEELEAALAIVLAAPPDFSRAPARVVSNFIASANHAMHGWLGFRAGPVHAPAGIAIAALLKGRTVLMLCGPANPADPDGPGLRAALTATLDAMQAHDFTYAQVIVPPECDDFRSILASAGFGRLTTLVYLERDSRYPWVDPPSQEYVWVSYAPHEHVRFGDTITATYEGTLDCPELVGLRAIDDIILSHQGAGPFDPSLWNLLIVDDQPAAVLLCSNHPHALEIVYVGVRPEFRRRGLAGALMRRALLHARNYRANQIMVAVDNRNDHAMRLYERFGFEAIAKRDVFLLTKDAHHISP